MKKLGIVFLLAFFMPAAHAAIYNFKIDAVFNPIFTVSNSSGPSVFGSFTYDTVTNTYSNASFNSIGIPFSGGSTSFFIDTSRSSSTQLVLTQTLGQTFPFVRTFDFIFNLSGLPASGGSVTVTGGSFNKSFGLRSSTLVAMPVPEATYSSLLLSGLILLVFVARRKISKS